MNSRDDYSGSVLPQGITTAPVSPATWPDALALFEPSSGCDGCWCFNHHIPPGQPDVRGDAACDAKAEYVRTGRASGLLAYLNGTPVGWAAVDRRRDIAGHDCVTETGDDAAGSVWVLHCFFVLSAARGQGVARALLRAALDWLRDAGADLVEAFPSPPGDAPAFGGFAGPYALFESEGFEMVRPIDADYCCVQLRLGTS